jgi:hypothetical protein
MAYDHKSVIEAQYQQLTADRAAAVAEYEAQRIAEDQYGTMSAADRILEADAKLAALNRIADTYVAGQQRAAPQNRYGLSKDEQEVAHGLASGDRTMTNDQREQVYAQNRAKYQRMRASGEYRDDQGRVTR